MVGAGKKRVQKNRGEGGAQSEQSSTARSEVSHVPQPTSSPSPSNSAPQSEAIVSQKSTGTVSPSRFDGNRDPEMPESRNLRNMDLGIGIWSTIRGQKIGICKRPPKPSTLGREIQMGLNTFNVNALPKKPVYQYDILAGTGAEKRGLNKKLWTSKAVKRELGPNAGAWLFDGNKLAWSLDNIDREIRVQVDLDAEENRTVKPGGKPNKHRVIIKKSTTIRFDLLDGYLSGKCDFDNKCLEAITFVDHLLREYPSQEYTQIKRNFFARGQKRFPLGTGIEAFKGVYQSIRIAHQAGGKHCMTVNVDVANGTFWTEGPLIKTVVHLAKAGEESKLVQFLTPRGNEREARGFTELKRLRKLHVIAAHNHIPYVIDRFVKETARTKKVNILDSKTGTEKVMSIYEYFTVKYKIRLQWPDLPLVKMTKGKDTVIPMELLKLVENQRYVYKLDDRQTSQMIKFAVTPPAERWQAVEHGLGMVKWQEDPYLRQYGMTIDPKKVTVKARLIQSPVVQFQGGAANPGTSGRWDLKGKKFLNPNTGVLKSWGVCVVQGRMQPDLPTVTHFIQEFVKSYKNHGGRTENMKPIIHRGSSQEIGKTVEEIWNLTGNKSQSRPQILVFILPDRDSMIYGRIKKSCECRFGVVSQCMQYAHVQKCQPQYISNVLMKFNAKLGGATSRAVGATSKGESGLFRKPTMIIGADVSHAAPGTQTASTASLTVSMDRLGIRYAAGTNTNGYRVEMISRPNFDKVLFPLFYHWVTNVGAGKFPERIIYFRDGVSEGQFQHVLQQEVQDIKKMIMEKSPCKDMPKFLVIVASKRHHIRFFPPQGTGDRNGNPLPGTLVETGVTHPFENDFYLCAHSAIKGTARPTHYHVLMNETDMPNEEIQTLIYEHSYQYIRATTPVSLFPAVYYAHLASLRGAHHDRAFGGGSNEPQTQQSGSGSQSGSQGQQSGTGSSNLQTEFRDLMTMPNENGISTAMWFI